MYWRGALDAIFKITDNPKAGNLLNLVKKRARKAINISRKNIPKIKYLQERGKTDEFLQVLNRVEDELNKI